MGTPFLTGFARSRGFREYRGLGWLTVVRQPLSRTFGPADELRRAIGRWGIAFVAVLTVVVWFFFTPLARRMRGIKTAADRIRQGDVLTVMPQPRDQTELSAMCHSLGALVEEFRGKKNPPTAEPPPTTEPARPPERGGEYVKPTGTDPRRVVW
jgi:HAMP domain-containing protein